MKRPQPIEKYSHIESCPHESFNAGHLHICESGCHKPQLYIEGWNAAQKHRDVEDADKRKLEQAEPKAEGDGLEDAALHYFTTKTAKGNRPDYLVSQTHCIELMASFARKCMEEQDK